MEEQLDLTQKLKNIITTQQNEIYEFIFKVKNCLSNMQDLPPNLATLYQAAIKLEEKLEEYNEEFEEIDLDESDFRRKTLQKMLIKKQQEWDSKSHHSEEQQKVFKNFEGIVVDPKGFMRSMIKMKIAEDEPKKPFSTFINDESIKERLSQKFSEELSRSKQARKTPKFFENFIVIGPDLNKWEDTDEGGGVETRGKEEGEQRIYLEPTILYDFDTNNKSLDEKEFYSILPKFCFPSLLPLSLLPHVSSSLSFLPSSFPPPSSLSSPSSFPPPPSSFLLPLLQYEYKKEGLDDCFVLVLRTQSTYEADFGEHSLKLINPHRVLYGVCFQITDVVQKGRGNFWKAPKVFCFLTYYPFSSMFLDIIKNIMAKLKIIRTEKLDFQSLLLHSLQHPSNDFLNSFTEQHLKSVIQPSLLLLSSHLPSFLSSSILPSSPSSLYPSSPSSLLPSFPSSLPSSPSSLFSSLQSEGLSMEALLWCAPLVFSNIPFEDFRFILYAFLLDEHIALFSENKNIVTLSVIVFYCIIKPLLYQGSVISILPEDIFEMTDAPTPYLIGLNIGSNTFNDFFAENRNNVIFYDLDNNEFICANDTIQEIRYNYPTLRDLKHALLPAYTALNPLPSKRFSHYLPFLAPKKNLILAPTPAHFENSKEIINAIKYRIEYFLLGEEGMKGKEELGKGIGRGGGGIGGGGEGGEAGRAAVEVGEREVEGGRGGVGGGKDGGIKEEQKRVTERGENKRDARFLKRWVETQSVVYFLEGNEDV